MARIGLAPTAQDLPLEFWQALEQILVVEDPDPILRKDFGAVTILADVEGIAPSFVPELRIVATDVDAVGMSLLEQGMADVDDLALYRPNHFSTHGV